MNQKEKPPDKVTMMDYEETFGQGEAWENSRLWADEMMRSVPGLREHFRLDQITLGDGQCFMTSVIQQLRRSDVSSSLSPRWQHIVKIMDPRALKYQVKKFMQGCQHQKVQDLKMNWRSFTGMSWFPNVKQTSTGFSINFRRFSSFLLTLCLFNLSPL